MRHRILVTTALIGLLALPIPAGAQEDPAEQALGALQRDLLERLCSVELVDEAALAECLRAAEAASAEIDVQAVVEQALASAQAILADVDLRAIVDATVSEVQDVDLEAALDEAVAAASEVDLETALADVLERAQAVDLQAAVDHALAGVDETLGAVGEMEVRAVLEDGVQTTRQIVAEAEAWLEENAEVVCTGSSLGVGAGAAAVVAYVTGSPGLAIRAFEEAERASSDVCVDLAVPASPDPG